MNRKLTPQTIYKNLTTSQRKLTNESGSLWVAQSWLHDLTRRKTHICNFIVHYNIEQIFFGQINKHHDVNKKNTKFRCLMVRHHKWIKSIRTYVVTQNKITISQTSRRKWLNIPTGSATGAGDRDALVGAHDVRLFVLAGIVRVPRFESPLHQFALAGRAKSEHLAVVRLLVVVQAQLVQFPRNGTRLACRVRPIDIGPLLDHIVQIHTEVLQHYSVHSHCRLCVLGQLACRVISAEYSNYKLSRCKNAESCRLPFNNRGCSQRSIIVGVSKPRVVQHVLSRQSLRSALH